MELISDAPWATVWRDGDTWLKRCNAVQLHEVPLTVALAARWPDRVPELLEHGDDWLLLADAGTPLQALGDAVEAWKIALQLYAELQQGEAAHADGHLAAGVPDQRVETLVERYETFPDERLRPFAPRFRELCARLTLPPTVQHDDLHAGNVFAKDGRVRVLDWGDAVIGHPFTSLVIPLRVHADIAGELQAAYLDAWPSEARSELDAALAVGAFTRILSWQRIGEQKPLRKNVEWFLANVAS
jgi:hypothetical protein